MKPSRYNVIFYCNKKIYIFNTMSCALAEINNELALKLKKAKILKLAGQKKIKDQMEKAGFIINDDVDELAILKYRHYKGKSSNVATITVAPTLQCNFECPYCYESSDNKFIKNEVKEALYKKIEELLKKGKKISVIWFGGEPLLAKNVIWEMSDKISKICENYHTKCVFDMSTNGYLLDRSTIAQLLDLGINSIQVTLDGTPEIHNKRRKLKDSDADTFYKIIENIKTGIRLGLNFRIRINVDKTNISCLDNLLKILVKEGLQNTFVNLVCVREYTKPKMKSIFNTEEASEVIINFSKLLKKYGFKHYDDLCYPFALSKGGCSAEFEDNLIIDPNGYLYKCIVETGNIKSSYGNILTFSEEDNEAMNNLKYLMSTPFERKECINCRILPLCMGGCTYYALKYKNRLDCSIWKYNLENKLSEICKIIKN